MKFSEANYLGFENLFFKNINEHIITYKNRGNTMVNTSFLFVGKKSVVKRV